MNRFSTLFKKYRLRSEFETLSQLGLALAEKGYVYDESIFSHWQKGTRIPSRGVLIKLIHIFVEHNAIRNIQEANEFLESGRQGFLTVKEKNELHFSQEIDIPFQVPSEIAHFTGREQIITKIKKELLKGKIVLLHGPPGVGKTALAIKLGHFLRSKFPDGVLWYKVDSTNVMDILLSMAHIFGEDISMIKDIEVRASAVRTLLAKRKLLLIFDNVSNQEQLHLLLPNSQNTSVIFSSQEHSLKINTPYVSFPIDTFTQEESLDLFINVLGVVFVKKNSTSIKTLSDKLGHLPLALNIVANYIKQSKSSIEKYQKKLSEESIDLQTLTYEDKNLFKTISTIYSTLPTQSQTVFTSLGVFEGKDFPMEAVSFINKLPLQETEEILETLQNISFIEQSKPTRYRIHPVIRAYARGKLNDQSLFLRAAAFYEQLLTININDKSIKNFSQEVDNIIYIFKKCYEAGYWVQIITIWNPLEKFLSDINELKKLRYLSEMIETAPSINVLQKVFSLYFIFILIYWITIIFSGLKTDFWNYMYSFSFSLIPFIGGFVGIILSKPWQLYYSNIGKAVFFISSGLFSWGLGSMVWVYYNLSKAIAVPYPSFADLGYFPSYFFWIAGIFYLSKATGAKLKVDQIKNNSLIIIVPFLFILFSWYFLFFIVDRQFSSQTPLRIFFDLYYPSMNIVILSLAISIFGFSINFFGGKYKVSLYGILLGFVFQYFGDFMFSYTTSQETYFNGNISDLGFTIGLFLLTWGTLSFYITPKSRID